MFDLLFKIIDAVLSIFRKDEKDILPHETFFEELSKMNQGKVKKESKEMGNPFANNKEFDPNIGNELKDSGVFVSNENANESLPNKSTSETARSR